MRRPRRMEAREIVADQIARGKQVDLLSYLTSR